MKNKKTSKSNQLEKTLTGIEGLDEITGGGLPKGRPTLICGSAGCGKSLMGIQFLVEGINKFNEPGVLMSFEETTQDIIDNVNSLGFDLPKLMEEKKLKIDHVRIERSEIDETGEYDLEALFVRLNYAIDTVGAKRVVLDTIETLFGGLENEAVLRSEIRRLFHWLKEKGVTAIITGERGESTLTRQGLEEYVSDCVILLDFRVADQIATRRLRIVKYRGSTHGTNEYPFVIDDRGISVLPITSLKLNHTISTDIISMGIPGVDALFHEGGIFRGTSILITGSAGTAKTILASHFAVASCSRNEKVIFFSFEESPDQLMRNMSSIGLNLKKFINSGMLIIHASRPSLHGLEMHLLDLQNYIREWHPKTVIIDPISSLITVGTSSEVKAMLVRLIDMLKKNGINALFTSLSRRTEDPDSTEEAVSSLADTWIKLTNIAYDQRVDRRLLIVKSRGMGHSGAMMDFTITSRGVQMLDEMGNPTKTSASKQASKSSENKKSAPPKKQTSKTKTRV